jgi:signal transduction histidine kinase
VLRRFLIRDFLAVVALTAALGVFFSVLSVHLVPEWYWEAGSAATENPLELSDLKPLVTEFPDAESHPGWAGAVGRRFVGLPAIARVRVRGQDARILWSSEREERRQILPQSRELRDALAGRVVLQLTQGSSPRTREGGHLLAARAVAYLPILCEDGEEQIGVLELARAPGRLRRTPQWLWMAVWPLALAGGLVLYAGIRPLVGRPGRPGHQAGRSRSDVAPLATLQPWDHRRAGGAAGGDPRERAATAERFRKLGEVAGGVIHDVNNVLASIQGRTQLLRKRLQREDNAELARYLEVIEKVTQDGARSVRRLVEFTRPPRVAPAPPVDLNSLLEDVLEISRPRWDDAGRRNGRRYTIRLETVPLPPIAADPSELREALLNIVLNAFDAMPEGGELSVSTAGDAQAVCCVIADTGPGMPETVRRRIFEPFFTTKGERGTGLGLSVAHSLITRHGGRIEVDSRPGAGTIFTLRFPASDPADLQVAGPSPIPSPRP